MRAWPAVEVPPIGADGSVDPADPGDPVDSFALMGRPLRLFDTATRELRPVAAGQRARMYVCGITPYDATHLGHALTYVTFDLLHRLLLVTGHEVDYVQNVTDVDDPLFERANRDGVDWRALADRETELFRSDMTALRVLPPRHFVSAVEAIPLILRVIEQLRVQQAVYELDGDLYFSVAAASRFGEVGHYSYPEMVALSAERGGDPDRPGKKDPLDPVLWRRQRPGEPAWDSPFGPGRPGWHVECAAIALEHLGPTLDVQGGGRDLIFPHHECSAAHANVATGRWPFARAYVHSAMLGLDGEKMSKSRGNLVFVSQLLGQGVEPAAIRLALLDQPYRQDWEWTAEHLDRGQQRLARWRTALARPAGPTPGPTVERLVERLADDLDAPGALRAVDRWAEQAAREGDDPGAAGVIRTAVDALLGVAL